jgi:hypothetical protein
MYISRQICSIFQLCKRDNYHKKEQCGSELIYTVNFSKALKNQDFGVVPTVDHFSHGMVYHDAYPQIKKKQCIMEDCTLRSSMLSKCQVLVHGGDSNSCLQELGIRRSESDQWLVSQMLQ